MTEGAKKRIIFVDDESRVLQGIRRMLRPMRKEWDMSFAESGMEALELMEKDRFDVVVSDMRMPKMDGAELLTEVMKRSPETVRIILSGQADKEAMLRSIGPSHQYLSKPCDAELLKSTISRACALRDLINSERLAFVSQLKNLPSLPAIYNELVEELQSDDPSMRFVSRLIEQDVGMTAKILQLVNSAYFGVRRTISSTAQAVSMLGFENIRSLVLFTGIFSDSSKESAQNPDLDEIWKHSIAVGSLCQRIMTQEKMEKQRIDDGLTSGLLHDCGKIVLATHLPEKWTRAKELARKEKLSCQAAEITVFGASHAEVGAYLLGLWGLPDAIVESVAFHHEPTVTGMDGMNNTAIVYAANILTEHSFAKKQEEETGEKPEGVLLEFDEEYLQAIGAKEKIEIWKTLLG